MSLNNRGISLSGYQDSHEEQLDESVVEEQGRQSDENEQKDSNGESTLNKIAIMPEGVDR